jgi:hypothetical protein
MSSSFAKSAGLSTLSGQNLLNINFGIGTYYFNSGKVDWVFSNAENVQGYYQDFMDLINVANFTNDLYAIKFVDFTNQEERQKGVRNLSNQKGNEVPLIDRLDADPMAEVEGGWNRVGEGTEFWDMAKTEFGENDPPLGKIIPGGGSGGGMRLGKVHIGNYLLVNNKMQTFIHQDIFDINKNLILHFIEFLFEAKSPLDVMK